MHTLRTIALLAAGAGAFALASCATVEEAAVEKTSETYKADLLGSNEPGGGDPVGYGKAEISVADKLDQICWDINDLRGLDPITGAHVHKGAPGVNGPVVLTLKQAPEGGWKGCANKSEWTEDSLENNYAGFYVNVHTTAYPNGAIRGQLHQ